MGGSIATGAIEAGVVEASDITISDPSSKLADRLKKDGVNINYTTNNKLAISNADMIVVAVKPDLMEGVLGEISDIIDRRRQIVVSIAAGVSFEDLGKLLDEEKFGAVGLYRVVPNIAIAIRESVTFIASQHTVAEQDNMVMTLFKALGTVYVVGEKQFTAVTALASSGIAYALRYMSAAAEGGQKMGLDCDESLKIVIDTMKGAISILEANHHSPQELIDRVSTPGGITIKGLAAMERSGFSQAVINGLLATKF